MSRAGRGTAWYRLGRAGSGLGGEAVSRRQVYLVDLKTKDDTSTSGSVCSSEPCMPFEKSVPGCFIHTGVSICPVLSLTIKYRRLHMLLQSCHAVLGYQER